MCSPQVGGDAKHVLRAGLCASYAEEGIRFVPAFDKAHHDPARTWTEQQEFAERMRLLFLEGHIWGVQADAVEELGSEKTLVEIVLDEAKNAPTIYYGDDGRVLRLFRRPDVAEQQALQAAVHQATQVMLDRVEVELSLSNGFVSFTALNLHRWRQAFLLGRQGDDSKLVTLRRHARRALAIWRLDSDAAVGELEGVAAKLVQDHRSRIDSGKVADGREIWVLALHPNFGRSISAKVQDFIRIYMAALDGTCGVERDLGALTRVLKAHSGPMDQAGESISDCVELLLDGPQTKEEVAKMPEVGESGRLGADLLLLPTDFSRECVALWLKLHGRRFLIYKPKTAGRKRALKAGTMASVIRGVAHATDKLVKQAREANGCDTTVLGIPRHQLIKRNWCAAVSPKLTKFINLTVVKRQRTQTLEKAREMTRRSQRNPFKTPELNPNHKLRRGCALTAKPKPTQNAPTIAPVNGTIAVASCCSEDVPPTPGYQILKVGASGSVAAALQQLMRAQVVVLDATWQLDGVAQAQHLISAIVVVGLGKAVLCRHRWRGPRPHTSMALVQYLPAAYQVPAKLQLVGELESRHASVGAALRAVAAKGKAWSIVNGEASKDVIKLDSLTAVRDFLRRSRRVYSSRKGLVTTLIRQRE